MEGCLSRKNMQGTGILMGSFRTLDIEELVASHMGCLVFLPLLVSQANMRELISNKTIGTCFSCQNGAICSATLRSSNLYTRQIPPQWVAGFSSTKLLVTFTTRMIGPTVVPLMVMTSFLLKSNSSFTSRWKEKQCGLRRCHNCQNAEKQSN